MKKLRTLGRSLPLEQFCLILLGMTLWPEMELLVPSLPQMKTFFSVTEGQIQQLLSANFIGFLCGVMFAGPLCDSMGRKKVSIFGMMVYLAASLLAALADSFSLMMLARFIQGVAITGPIIGGITMLMETTFGPKQVFWLSLSSASITFSMAGAPIFGAWINEAFGFRGNLWAIFIAGVIGFLPFFFIVKESLAKDQQEKMKVKLVVKNYLEILKNKKFMGIAFIITALSASYWVYTGVSSLYMVDYLQMDAALFGRYQGPIVGTFAVLSVSISWLHKKYGIGKCLVMGFVCMFFGAFGLMIMCASGLENALMTTICMMFFVGGMVPANSLLFPSAINLLPKKLQGSGQSLIQAMRLFIASMGTLTLGFVYSGPFLPVAIILISTFVVTTILVWKMKSSIKDTSGEESGIVACH